MKTPSSRGSLSCLVAAGVWTLVGLGSASLQAAGSGPGVGIAAANGAAVSSGGHAAPVSAGSAHISAPAAIHGGISSPGGISSGFRNGGSLHPITATYNGPAHYLPGGFAPSVVSHAPSMRTGVMRSASVSNTARINLVLPASTATVHNAWSDPSSNHLVNGHGNNFTGTVLYPDSLPDSPGSRFGSGTGVGIGSSYRLPHYHLRNRGYNSLYGYPYPYLFSGGYTPYFDGVAASASDEAIAAPENAGAGSNELSAAAINDLSRPYPSETYAANAPSNAADAPQASSSQTIKGNTGPDSLVEAVQAELSRRGYFGGKVDAIYGDATHTAIQRFQADQQLPATGRINEATLHALQLD